MKKKALIISTVAGLLAVGGLAITGVVLAQDGVKTGIRPFDTIFAQKLGVDQDTYCTAKKDAQIETVDLALKDGKITQEQAEKAKTVIKSSECGAPMRPQRGPMGNPAKLAEFLGITVQELKDYHDQGKTIKDIAKEKGISMEDLKKFIEENKPEKPKDANQATGSDMGPDIELTFED
jgi:hypothetical protein